jgi:hypothetical protein
MHYRTPGSTFSKRVLKKVVGNFPVKSLKNFFSAGCELYCFYICRNLTIQQDREVVFNDEDQIQNSYIILILMVPMMEIPYTIISRGASKRMT